nr:TLC domain-containing protein At5g14285 [Tanacetum cinerariifolium]
MHSHTPKQHFASQNTPFQAIVLEFSIAYFIIDTSHYLIFTPNDHLFIAHHLAVLYVFITCRYIVQHGAFAILLLLVLAEVTSLLQNTWSLARYRKDDMAFAARLYDGLCPYFYGFYSVVRGVFGPLFVYQMIVFYLKGGGDGLVPMWAWVSWMVVIVSAIFLELHQNAINARRLPLALLVYILMTTSVGNNSVFRSFFEKQKLTGPNFIDWYIQLRLVLSIEDKENYLEHLIPAAAVAPHGQQVPPEALAAHAA